MKKSMHIKGLAVAFFLAAPSLGVAIDSVAASEDTALRSLVSDIQTAINTKDLEAYSRLLSPEIVAIEPDGEFRGREALLERFRKGAAGPSAHIESQPVYIRLLSPHVAVGLNHWTFSIGGMPPFKGGTLWTASKTGGKWVFEGWSVVASATTSGPK